MAAVILASRYVTSASRYQSRSSMYTRGLIPRNSTTLAKAVPIDKFQVVCSLKKVLHIAYVGSIGREHIEFYKIFE